VNTHSVARHNVMQVMRFPRFSEDDNDKLRVLVAEGWTRYQRGYPANVELGRVFRRIKKIVGHGNWERYYNYYFPDCVALRTARTYMELAKKEDAKTADSAVFKPRTHDIVRKVQAARTKAQAEAGPKKFHIALSVPPEQQDAVRKLQRSLDWPKAEAEIIAILTRYIKSSEVPNEGVASEVCGEQDGTPQNVETTAGKVDPSAAASSAENPTLVDSNFSGARAMSPKSACHLPQSL
jgi:hypothetical protein